MRNKWKRLTAFILLLALLLSNLVFPTEVNATGYDDLPPDQEYEEWQADLDGINNEMDQDDEEKVYFDADDSDPDDFADDTVLVVLKKTASEINEDLDLEGYNFDGIAEVKDLTELTDDPEELGVEVEEYHQIFALELEESGEDNVLDVIAELEQHEDVLYAGPNSYDYPDAIPNDTYYSTQYAHKLISSESAWNITTGSKSVKVGIIDSGIYSTHSDLNANVSAGRDFYNEKNITNATDDDHGTHVAGIVGAVGNNRNGIAGVCWNVNLIPLKVSYKSDGETKFDVASVTQAISYATSNNIGILNYSGGGSNDNYARYIAIKNYPGLFVASAGNKGKNTDISNNAHYPSGYDLDNLISVANSTAADVLSSSSNYGLKTVDLAAPGDNIYSTMANGSYHSMDGTSMAAPQVTGAAALIKSKYPDISAQQLKVCLMQVDKISSMSGKMVSGGRLNVKKALDKAAVLDDTYYYSNPGSVVLLDTEPIYKSTSFSESNQTGKMINEGVTVKVQGVEFSPTGLPRLKIDGGYITANKNYVSKYYQSSPGTVVLLSKETVYSTPGYDQPTGKKYEQGTSVKVTGIAYSASGIPRLKVAGGYITANVGCVSKYYVNNPGTVVLLEEQEVYRTSGYGEPTGKTYAKNTPVKVEAIAYSGNGIPRLKVRDGYITANAGYVSKYYLHNPGTVTALETQIVYKDADFTQKTGNTIYNGSTIKVTGIEYSNNGVPRFKISGGYITANANYVSQYFISNPGTVVLLGEEEVYSHAGFKYKTGKTYKDGVTVKVEDIEYADNGIPRLKVPGGYITANVEYVSKYYLTNPDSVVLLEEYGVYSDTAFSQLTGRVISKGESVNVTGIEYADTGVPRLKIDGGYITANVHYSSRYYLENPGKVVLLNEEKIYSDPEFKQTTGNTYKKGVLIDVEELVYANNGIPRLKTADGYITANVKYVMKVDY